MRNFRMEKLAGFMKMAAPKIMSTTEPFPAVILGETKESYLERAADSGSQKDKESLEAYFEVSSEKASNSAFEPTKPTAKPASKSKPVFHSDVINSTHWGKTINDAEGYTYTISGDGRSLSYKKGNSKEVKLNQSYKNWKAVVTNINKLPISAPTTTATSAATTAPAAAAATTSSGPTKPYDTKETILGQVLQKMYDDKLVGTPGPDLTNEKRRVKIIMDGIGGGPETGKSFAGGAARVLLNQSTGLGESISPTYNETISNITFLTSIQQAINGLYDSAFRWSRTLAKKDPNHAGFWKRLGGRTVDSKSATIIISNYIRSGLKFSYQNPVITPTTPPAAPASPTTPPPVVPPAVTPAAPAAPAANADDGQVKKSSLDKKFIKAATLRRLKIRSQMEAAIDSSAQMGRARVY